MIAIIDYGMGNLRSVQKAINRLGCDCIISKNLNELKQAEKLVLPGVGHFARGMSNLRELKLVDFLNDAVCTERKPILGICLGMQLMTEHSEEGNCAGLGWIGGKTMRFHCADIKVPHIGWNTVAAMKKMEKLNDITGTDEFYFVHSYYVACADREDVLFQTRYGIGFDSGVMKGNIVGFQFHPEKSHRAGLKALNIFLAI